MVFVIAWTLHNIAQRENLLRSATYSASAPLPVDLVVDWFPGAATVATAGNDHGLQEVRDDDAKLLGYVGLTLPTAAHVIGYRGPSQSLIAFDADGQHVLGVKCLESQDTPEHFASVLKDSNFFKQFRGWSWNQASGKMDAVSGATLTSLAIAESVVVRLGGEKPSLRFPDVLTLEEAQAFWPEATAITAISTDRIRVIGPEREQLGSILRTGVLVDTIEGYQGPTEVMLAFDLEERCKGIRLRKSYDNQPYVGYVKTEASFWKRFRGRSAAELARIDPKQDGIEGVSGATMTSLAVAETIPETLRRDRDRSDRAKLQSKTAQRQQNIHLRAHDFATLLIVIGALGMAHSSLRGQRWLRRSWNVMLVAYFGMITGNLLSQALIFGWIQGGIAWRLAPGLATVAAVAVLWPSLSKRNVYCHHLCPHGAAQQLVRGWGGNGKASPRWHAIMSWFPGVLLVAIILITALKVPLNLANLEPFDAYLWRIAGWASITLALGSLLLATRYPMAYCQYGCPTGRMLEYFRRTGRSDRWSRSDTFVLLLLIAIQYRPFTE